MEMTTSSRRTATPLVFGIAYFAIFAGNNVWRFTFHNYTIETFNVTATQIGLLFSISAIPGVMAFSIGYIAKSVRLSLFMIFSCTLVGAGLVGIGTAPTWYVLWPAVLAVNIGFTIFYPVVNSLGLQGSAPEETLIFMGRLKSFGPLSAVITALLIHYALEPLGYNAFQILAGILILLCGFIIAFYVKNKEYALEKGNLRFKIRLWPYYALNFLAGCRSAFFKTFVLYLLIKEFDLPIHRTATLVLIGNLCSFLSYRLIGQIANRYKPRNILSGIYLFVALAFIGFRAFDNLVVLSMLYCFDSLLFGASVITDSHLRKISSPQNYVGDIATGLTLFYIAGTILPLVAGYIWDYRGAHSAFVFGSLLAIVAALVSRKI
jgi:predicted MFS family arabinose efflux permease